MNSMARFGISSAEPLNYNLLPEIGEILLTIIRSFLVTSFFSCA